MTLWQRDNYQPERGSLKSFLGLLTRHRAIDKLRKRNTTQKFLARWELNIYESSSSTLPLEAAQSQEQQKQLQKVTVHSPLQKSQEKLGQWRSDRGSPLINCRTVNAGGERPCRALAKTSAT